MHDRFKKRSTGFSLMEIMVALAIVALMATVASHQYFTAVRDAKKNTSDLVQADIEMQVERFYRDHGRYPNRYLSDIGRMSNYFPDGVPRCPIDNRAFGIDISNGKVRVYKR